MPHPISSRASISGAVVAALLQPRPHRTTLRCVGSYLRDLAQLTATLHRLPNPIVRLFRGNNTAPLPSNSSSRGRRLRLAWPQQVMPSNHTPVTIVEASLAALPAP